MTSRVVAVDLLFQDLPEIVDDMNCLTDHTTAGTLRFEREPLYLPRLETNANAPIQAHTNHSECLIHLVEVVCPVLFLGIH